MQSIRSNNYHYSEQRFSLSQIIEEINSNKLTVLDLELIETNGSVQYYDGEQYVASTIGDVELIQLATVIKNNTSLQKIYLKPLHNTKKTWTLEGTKALGNALKDHPTLNHVEIGLHYDENTLGFLDCLSGSANIETLLIHFSSDNATPILDEIGNHFLSNQRSQLKTFSILGSSPSIQDCTQFAKGLASLNYLTNLELERVCLGDLGVKTIADAFLDNEHSSEQKGEPRLSFRKIHFIDCNITTMDNVLRLVRNSPDLNQLMLDQNEFSASELMSLLVNLHNLKGLIALSLKNVNAMNQKALSFLSQEYQEQKLTITELNFSFAKQEMDSETTGLSQLIDGNKRLKKLVVLNSQITEAGFTLLLPVLKNPDRCQLEQFRCLNNSNVINSQNVYTQCLNILDLNEHLDVVELPLKIRHCTLLQRKANYKKYQKYNEIDSLMCIFQSFYAFPKTGYLVTVPAAIFTLMLTYLVPKTSYGKNCLDGIQANMKRRAAMMTDTSGVYDLKKGNLAYNRHTITSIWWTNSIKRNLDLGQLKPSQIKTNPHLIELQNLMTKLSHNRIVARALDVSGCIIIIDLDGDPEQNRIVKDNFIQFFSILQDFCYKKPPLIYLDVAQLIIKGIHLKTLKKIFDDLSPAPMVEETKCKLGGCSLM